MNTLSLELTGVKEADLPVIETILKKFKIKSKVVKQDKDDTKMTKEAFYQMIDEARKEKTIRMSAEEMRAKYLR